jgi:GNAT superfamily N-acetyltransferase
MRIQKIDKIDNIDKLSKIIFLNFFYLKDEPHINFSYKDIQDCLSSKSLLGWFLIDNNEKIIGYLIGTHKDIGDGRYVYFINYFYIISRFRKNGIGTKMILSCIQYIKNININFIMLISKIGSNAYRLYQQLGFVKEPIIKIDNPKFNILLYYC